MKSGQISFFVTLALGTSLGALAAPEDTAGIADENPLQEVVVTAQRRSESAQSIPIAITAISGADLDGKGVSSLDDLQFAAPAVSIGNNGDTNAVNIRGVGLASGLANVANGVAIYVDGVFQPQIVANTSMYDIADVEVLRGPQGTLVGSNSTGGAIFINTQSPRLNVLEGYTRLGFGNYNQVDAQGAINLPVNDVLAFRVAGSDTSRDSFYRSIGPAYTDAGELREQSGRISMLFKPGDFQALAKIEYTDRNTGGYTGKAIPGTAYASYSPADPFSLTYDTPTEDHETGLAFLARTEVRIHGRDRGALGERLPGQTLSQPPGL